MNILFDIGCNKGDYTLTNIHKYDKVVCVDASYIQIEIIKTRVPLDKCHIVNALVTGDEKAKFYICSASGISTASYEWIFGKGRFAPGNPDYDPSFQWMYTPHVQKITIDELVEKYGTPSFIKVDVEGYEDNVLRTMSKMYCPIAFEFSEELLDEHINTLEYLNGLGFSMFYIQQPGDAFDFVPKENEYINYDSLLKTMKTEFNPELKRKWGMIWCK